MFFETLIVSAVNSDRKKGFVLSVRHQAVVNARVSPLRVASFGRLPYSRLEVLTQALPFLSPSVKRIFSLSPFSVLQNWHPKNPPHPSGDPPLSFGKSVAFFVDA